MNKFVHLIFQNQTILSELKLEIRYSLLIDVLLVTKINEENIIYSAFIP